MPSWNPKTAHRMRLQALQFLGTFPFAIIFETITNIIPPEDFLCNVAATGVSLFARNKPRTLLCKVPVLCNFYDSNCPKTCSMFKGIRIGAIAIERILREPKFRTEFPYFSREQQPEFRRKRDLYEPLLTAMAQAIPSLVCKEFFFCDNFGRDGNCLLIGEDFWVSLGFQATAAFATHFLESRKTTAITGKVWKAQKSS